MKLIRNRSIPFKGYSVINLFGILFARMEARLDAECLNHEGIHTVQIIEMAVAALALLMLASLLTGLSPWWWLVSPCAFYVWYGLEYVTIRLFHRKQGDTYHDVSFEEEAHNNDKNLNYLKERRHFAWLKFVRVRSWKK